MGVPSLRSVPMSPERALWSIFEPVHAVCYFHPEVAGGLAEVGLHGFWNGYFAGRTAPLGPVGPAPVTSLFFVFAPDKVAKALPKIWGRTTPEETLTSRLESVGRALTPLLPDEHAVGRAADRLVEVAERLNTDGRALAASWQGVEPPNGLAAKLWWATTVLREHRGDGHVLAATHAGLSGLELRRRIEDDTDRLASQALGLLGDDLEPVHDVLAGVTRAIAEAGALPTATPLGLPQRGRD